MSGGLVGVVAAAAVLLSASRPGGAAAEPRHRRAVLRRLGARPGPWVPALPPRVAAWLAAADVDMRPDHVVVAWAVCSAAGALGAAVLVGAAAAPFGLAAGLVAPVIAVRAAYGRAARRAERALPDALEAVAGGLRSGSALRAALRDAAAVVHGRLADELATVVRAADSGQPLAAALAAWADRAGTPGVTLTVAGLTLALETGGAQAAAVDGLADTLRSRTEVADETRAHAAQARLSALVVAAAPAVFCALAAATDPRIGTFLFAEPLGLAMLTVGLGLDAGALWWMHRMTAAVT